MRNFRVYLPRLPLILVCFSTALLFQNCGPAGYSVSDSLDSSGDQSSTSPMGKTVPFPYSYEPNQIAYNSCYANELSSDAMWTFAIGAYNNTGTPAAALGAAPGGITMNPNFYKAYQDYKKEMVYQDPKLAYLNLLGSLPQLRESKVHFSIREKSKVRSYMYARSPGQIEDQHAFAGPDLNSNSLFERFYSNPNQYLDYVWDGGGSAERSLSGTFRMPFGNNPSDVNFHRELSSVTYLVAGFAYNNGRDAQLGIGPELLGPEPYDKAKERIFGTGYRINFRGHSNLEGYEYSLDRGMSIDQEVNLENMSVKRTPKNASQDYQWDCSAKFKIVAQKDRNKSYYSYSPGYISGRIINQDPAQWLTCPQEDYCQLTGICNDPAMNPLDKPTTGQVLQNKALLQAMRRFLPAENWDINVSRRCVVPKFSGCYKDSQKIIYDDHFFSTDNDEVQQYAGCGPDHPGECPHFITLCIKR